jgi:hypothetical protein
MDLDLIDAKDGNKEARALSVNEMIASTSG